VIPEEAANTVAVYAVLIYGIVSAVCSSPQTAEINAQVRAATLMKWVHLALLQAAGFTLLGMWLDKRRWPPALGGGLAMTMLYAQYRYAMRCGLESAEPGTETY
jgi:hypothetical protein